MYMTFYLWHHYIWTLWIEHNGWVYYYLQYHAIAVKSFIWENFIAYETTT